MVVWLLTVVLFIEPVRCPKCLIALVASLVGPYGVLTSVKIGRGQLDMLTPERAAALAAAALLGCAGLVGLHIREPLARSSPPMVATQQQAEQETGETCALLGKLYFERKMQKMGGVLYEQLRPGRGPLPRNGDKVVFRCLWAKRLDGREIKSAAATQLPRVEAVLNLSGEMLSTFEHMRPGAVWRIIAPPDSRVEPAVAGLTDLLIEYEIELLAIHARDDAP